MTAACVADRRVRAAVKRAERKHGVDIARRWAVAYTAYMHADVKDRVGFLMAQEALTRVEQELAGWAAAELLPRTEYLAAINSLPPDGGAS